MKVFLAWVAMLYYKWGFSMAYTPKQLHSVRL